VTTIAPGYSTHAGTYSVPIQPKTTHRRLLIVWVGAIALVAAGLVAMSGAIEKPSARYMCPPQCGRPPIGMPVTINPRFTAPDGAFSVSYPAEGAAYKITKNPNGVTADLLAGDGGTMRLFSEPAAGRSPKDIAAALVNKTFPDTKTAYQIPNTMVGYRLTHACHRDGGGEGRSRPRRGSSGPVPRIRPRLRLGQAVGGQSADRAGHGQVRQQLQLARGPSAVTSSTHLHGIVTVTSHL
jgi:hypothetical protein